MLTRHLIDREPCSRVHQRGSVDIEGNGSQRAASHSEQLFHVGLGIERLVAGTCSLLCLLNPGHELMKTLFKDHENQGDRCYSTRRRGCL
jgi:hypothetical protein